MWNVSKWIHQNKQYTTPLTYGNPIQWINWPAGCKASDPPRAAQCVAQTFNKFQTKQKELLKVKTHRCHLSKWLYILLLPRRSSSLAARHTGTPREGPWNWFGIDDLAHTWESRMSIIIVIHYISGPPDLLYTDSRRRILPRSLLSQQPLSTVSYTHLTLPTILLV